MRKNGVGSSQHCFVLAPNLLISSIFKGMQGSGRSLCMGVDSAHDGQAVAFRDAFQDIMQHQQWGAVEKLSGHN